MNSSDPGSFGEAEDSIDAVTRRRLVLPFVALLGLAAAIVAALLFVAARGQDRIAAERSSALVRAMLADHLPSDENRALAHYQRFQERVIARLVSDRWTLTDREVDEALATIEAPDSAAA